jgi:hypothetical protein
VTHGAKVVEEAGQGEDAVARQEVFPAVALILSLGADSGQPSFYFTFLELKDKDKKISAPLQPLPVYLAG